MTTTSTDPREIEADLERERASLASTLDALSDRVSVDNLAHEALGMLKSRAGSATSTIDSAVRSSPLAVALIGAGIAWMFIGPRVIGKGSDDSAGSSMGSLRHDDGGWSGQGSSASGGSAYASGYGTPASSYGTPGSSYAASGSTYNRGGYATASSSAYDSSSDDDHAWSREAHGLRARAAEALHRIEQEAKSYYDSVRNGISSMTSGSGGQRDFDAERQSVISGFTSDLKARFAAGLDNLPEGSRQQIIAARERAYSAMLEAERMGRDMVRDPGRVMEEHPLVAGAVAFALGAVAGAMLPQTETENRAFGAERDRLMDEAARLLREEREHAMRLAGDLTDEVKAAAQETVQAVAGTVADKAQEAVGRVGERASGEFGGQGGSGSGQGGGSASGGASGRGLAGPGDPVIG